jgi:hypothetical protein
MNKRKGISAGLSFILLVVSLIPMLSLSALASPVTDSITVPDGKTDFSISLKVNEDTPYTGIEFALAISDETAASFASFTSGLTGASTVNPKLAEGLYYFGFYTGSNAFSGGETKVGMLDFTGYTGNQTLTITVVQMDVLRLNAEKVTVKTTKESPSYIFTVQRQAGDETHYTVTFDPAGGVPAGGESLSQSVPKGGAAIAPILTRDGFKFDGWDNSFTNVISDLTVTALWVEDAGGGTSQPSTAQPPATRPGESVTDGGTPLAGPHYFDDVDETHYAWALEAVDALAKSGVVKGMSDRIYSPALSIKRGDFTLMLARAYNINDEFTENFPDVPIGTYYYDAIGSAKIKGIAKGYSEEEFRPNAFMQRQEMMALIDRTLQAIGKTLPRGDASDLDIFLDRDLISDYALDSVAALVKSGIIKGSDNKVNPLGYTTRAEMAVALYRLLNLES